LAKVLVIDDQSFVARNMKRVFEKGGGHQVPFIGTSSDRDYRSEWESRGARFIDRGSSSKEYLVVAQEILD